MTIIPHFTRWTALNVLIFVVAFALCALVFIELTVWLRTVWLRWLLS